jgi:hypothetical protein
MNKLIAPIKAIKAQYIPLMTVYFAVGFAGIASVTNTLFFKNGISLTASDLISLGIWTGLPWSIKMVFGSLIDGLPIFGSNRKAYIYLGNLLIVLGTLGMIDHASTQYIFSILGEYGGLLLTGLLSTIGVVTSDIVADTMAIEVVEDGPNKDKELGLVQVLSRLALSGGALIGAASAGPLATAFTPAIVYTMTLVCPLLSTIATALTKLKANSVSQLNYKILLGGLGYGIFCILSGMFLGDYSQLVVFSVAMVVLTYMMAGLVKDMPAGAQKAFVMAMIAIFLFRVVPGVGPAGQWWYIEALGFDANFLGLLSTVAAISSFIVLWLLADSITNHSIFKTMLVLTGLVTVLSLPDILVYYGLHEALGVSARTLIMADTAIIGPLGQLSMIPLGVLVARNAPENSRAIYISLTASLMNIALVGGDLITRELNKIFIVTRTDFSEMGGLLIISLTISTVLSIIGLITLKRGDI